MEFHQGWDIGGHGLRTAPMVERWGWKDTCVRGVEVGSAGEASRVHGNIYGKD